jgi:hypothetical protein
MSAELTNAKIRDWWNAGLTLGASHVIIAYDSNPAFREYSQHYVSPGEDLEEVLVELRQIHEIIRTLDYSLDLDEQMADEIAA